MKNKFYIIVSVPMIEKEFDFYIPVNKKIGVVKKLIVSLVVEQSDQTFLDNGCRYLYDKITGQKLDENQFVKKSIIKNGSKLLLF